MNTRKIELGRRVRALLVRRSERLSPELAHCGRICVSLIPRQGKLPTYFVAIIRVTATFPTVCHSRSHIPIRTPQTNQQVTYSVGTVIR